MVNEIKAPKGVDDSGPSIVSVDTLLCDERLIVPSYQRPYMWTSKNIMKLILDIQQSIESEKLYANFKYRIGTVILYNNEDNKLEIVDGQQRILSLLLLKYHIGTADESPLFKSLQFVNKTTQKNLHNNYVAIRECLPFSDQKQKDDFDKALKEILEVVVIPVQKLEEAFQLFDSQNSRGRALYPHDLLKAYHLREMNDKYEMQRAVEKWEAKEPKAIKELFELYLYPIWNWSKREKTGVFTVAEIDAYKGISEESGYTYARRASKASPYFLLTAPFISGADFFEMVDWYMQLLHDIKEEVVTNTSLSEIKQIFTRGNDVDSAEQLDIVLRSTQVGLSHANNLFVCALLCYYDRFHNFDPIAIKKLFTWAMMLRVDMIRLGFASINKYAIGEGESYSNSIPMISMITYARKHTEISSIRLSLEGKNNPEGIRKELHNELKELNGYEPDNDDKGTKDS